MNRLALSLLVLLLLSACSPQVPPGTGMQGQVTIGPMCPVVQEGQECPDQAYQATLTVLTESGGRVTRFATDADGRFRVPLAPGTYVLHPETPEGMALPVAADQNFTVVEGHYTQIDVVYDSGIR
jgi:hypothetical protein